MYGSFFYTIISFHHHRIRVSVAMDTAGPQWKQQSLSTMVLICQVNTIQTTIHTQSLIDCARVKKKQ